MAEDYIKMCIAAEEIQQMWKPQKDDWWVYPKEDISGELLDNDIDKIRKGTIWIPRLDQLLQMGLTFDEQQWVHNFSRWASQAKFTKIPQGSEEEIWLVHIMWVKYNKYWNGEKWIYAAKIDENTTIHKDDIVNKKLCNSNHHKYGKEQGGVGIWPPVFPPTTEIDGAQGGAGCYWRICTRCGKVKMHGIHPIV